MPMRSIPTLIRSTECSMRPFARNQPHPNKKSSILNWSSKEFWSSLALWIIMRTCFKLRKRISPLLRIWWARKKKSKNNTHPQLHSLRRNSDSRWKWKLSSKRSHFLLFSKGMDLCIWWTELLTQISWLNTMCGSRLEKGLNSSNMS